MRGEYRASSRRRRKTVSTFVLRGAAQPIVMPRQRIRAMFYTERTDHALPDADREREGGNGEIKLRAGADAPAVPLAWPCRRFFYDEREPLTAPCLNYSLFILQYSLFIALTGIPPRPHRSGRGAGRSSAVCPASGCPGGCRSLSLSWCRRGSARR